MEYYPETLIVNSLDYLTTQLNVAISRSMEQVHTLITRLVTSYQAKTV